MVQAIQGFDFGSLPLPPEVRARVAQVQDPVRWALENKIRSYNQLSAEPDGSGIDCPDCRNKGVVAVLDEDGSGSRMLVRPCACRSRRATALRLKACGMLDRAKLCSFERFRTDTPLQRRMKELALAWVEEAPGPWLAFCGQSVAGKTHLCTAAFVQAVARRGLAGEYMLWGPALREIKGDLPECGAVLLERYKSAPLLYVDDLFKGRADLPISDWDLRLAFELLDYRYANSLPTILSTERSFPELVRLDEAIAGRLRERCGKYLINITPEPEKNYRFRGRENEK